ncbi:MAG: fbiB [Herminiimonas sp.]|nr:fbiB [Herminiimonas sp.]MDB5855800.1 fbiB [Herminiimonas sp.]
MNMECNAIDLQDVTVTLLAGRRSIRRYEARPVPLDITTGLLEAAVCAPSAHNRQPWRFAVIEKFERKDKLARAMGVRLRADRMRDHDDAEAIEQDVARSRARIVEAPLCILVALTMEEMDRYPDSLRSEAEHTMAVQSTAMAMQNLLIAAHGFGLGASIMCAPLFCPEVIVSALDLPSHWQAQALVTVGYPAQQKMIRRRPLSDVALFLDRAP